MGRRLIIKKGCQLVAQSGAKITCPAQNQLAKIYERGAGVPKNYKESLN